jgi:hypothetical protein
MYVILYKKASQISESLLYKHVEALPLDNIS